MTGEQNRIIDDILSNMDEYLKFFDGAEKTDLDYLHKKFLSLHRQYIMGSVSHTLDVLGKLKANQQRKVDPFIAGGLANGVGGLGSGLSVAGMTAVKNQKIDQNRKYYEQKVSESERSVNSMERELLNVAESINAILNSNPQVSPLRQKWVKKQYMEAKKLMKKFANGEARRKAIRILEEIEGYEDSGKLLEKCRNREKRKYLLYANMWGLFAVALIVFCSIFYSAMDHSTDAFFSFIFICAPVSYGIAFIYAYIKAKMDPFFDF